MPRDDLLPPPGIAPAGGLLRQFLRRRALLKAASRQPARRLAILPETGHRPAPPPGAATPLVSVIVTSFNYGAFVTAAVHSVLAQTFQDLEVIVVEGGSPDPASRAIVAALDLPRTRVLQQPTPQPAGANRNFGISQCHGRYICCLDADDTLAPTYIEKAVYLLERHGYDVVSSGLRMNGDGHGQVHVMHQPDLADLLDANHVLTSAVFRRVFWERAGGYRDMDHAVSGYVFEDWAFWIRLAALGARFRNLADDPMLHYRVHAASLSRGQHALPLWQQRQFVRQMNADLLTDTRAAVARSRRAASRNSATPLAAPAPINPAATPNPRTLLLAMPFLTLGGAERLLAAITGHLAAHGWRIVIVTTLSPAPDTGDTTAWFDPHTADIFHLPRFLPPDMWEDFLHHLVASRGVTVAWIAGSAFAYNCLRGLRAAHPALRVADLLFNTVGHMDNHRRRRAFIDAVFVENQEVRRHLLAHGASDGRIRLVESGVDLATLRPRPRDPALIARIGAAPADLIIGFSGRWSEEKNPLAFIELARLTAATPGLRFVMTGTGPFRAAIQRALGCASLPPGRFHLLGDVEDIAATVASYDLLVLPSTLDGRPVVVLEALALGVPVLASAVGALPDLIRHGITGWLAPPGDDAAFAARITHAAANRAALAAMRPAARAYAEAHLDRAAMFAAYRDGLEALLPHD
jgi:glycosyltransferase involved in cell wall biosynthesis